MTARKQTIWLMSMLATMVAMSAYYLTTGPMQPMVWHGKHTVPADTAEKQPLAEEGVEVRLKTVNPTAGQAKTSSDYFISSQLQRTTLRQRVTEDAMKRIADPKASREQIEAAQQQVEQLAKLDRAENTLEERIREQGFQDALVLREHPQVSLIVQSPQLTPRQVVQLIQLASKHFEVPSTQVSVSHRS